MDFSLGSIGGSGGFSSNGSSPGDRSLASITENRQHRMLGSPSSNEFLHSNSCRSATEVDLDSRDDQIIPSLKLARTDSSRWQPELKMSAPAGLLIRHTPMQFDCRMPYSPTSSRVSDDALLSCDSRFVPEPRLLRGDSLVSSASAFLGSHSPSLRHPPSYQESYVQHRPAGIPVLLGREAAAMLHAGMHDTAVAVGGRCLFTAAQWAELEHQALIYKYIMHGSSVPAELLHPIRRSVAAMSGMPHNLISGWGGFQLGGASNVDPEPGRCRRTDGKKWRCARPVVPEQKYCERHMHRGRHRRKAAEAQNNSSAQAAGGPSSSSAIVGAVAGRESNLSPGLARANHSFESTMAFNPQQPQLTKSLSNLAATAGNALLTTSAGNLACNQLSLPLHLPTGLCTNKDSRFLCHGINKAHFDLRPEQLLSDFSGSTRGLDPSKVSSLPSDHQLMQWHLQQSKMTPFGLRSSCGSFLQQDCDQIKFLHAQEMVTMAEANRLNQLLRQQQQQQMHLVDNRNVSVKTFTGDSKSENQPLRHFFDDWPRTRDACSLSWSDVDDENPKANGSSTQLSISITTASSSDISANDSPTRAKTIFSPLKLSMMRNGEDMADPPTHMGLGINLNHRKSSWFPTTLETSVGGPLGEVLQSGNPHPVHKEGLNVLKEDWDSHSQDAPQNASPTGVLQKPALGCFSDSSSNASSPGSVRTEHAISENHKIPALMNAPSRLAT
ncbi:hypothetical protein O6H91_06G106800 [Diphasiastrum complanatum]|uniref:Uncharacterized protein n=1 Tax=Diphasiastrum complanatum TaxID=34168 RepID=A0ACC2DH76_DIPCM|nr:hypothetical protein O6H91_06G106800 [Diphasiastrum complanatum]